jgi:hypothetical protein
MKNNKKTTSATITKCTDLIKTAGWEGNTRQNLHSPKNTSYQYTHKNI